MNTRQIFSILIVCLGLTLAFMPTREQRLIRVKPARLTSLLNDEKSWCTVDQAAKYLVNDDTTVQLIDLRPAVEFMKMNIPGSINVPLTEFSKRMPSGNAAGGITRYILYAENDSMAIDAFILARGMNCRNSFIMKGGLAEWNHTIMNTRFTGQRISARENAIFETRTRASQMFSEFNMMPDSLKQKYFVSRELARKKLDGGCE